MKNEKRKDYLKLVEKLTAKNPWLSAYLAERAYHNNLSASIYSARFNNYLRGGK
jgi:hypothetical protein